MFNKILSLFGLSCKIQPLPDKDPKDHTLTASSTPWTSYKACPRCEKDIDRSEELEGICPYCGHIGKTHLWAINKYYRLIIKDGNWRHQYKD